MDPLQFLLVVAAGVVTGGIGSLLGIGGGIFLVPTLVLGFGLPMHQAVAASVITIIATSSASASVYVDKGLSNIRLGMALEVMTTMGAVAGGLAANALPADTLRRIFSVFVLVMAGLMWNNARRHGDAVVRVDPRALLQGAFNDPASGDVVRYSVRNVPAGMGASLGAGVLSGLLGVGGGLIKVPVMTMVCGVPIKAATATSNFMIGVTAVASAFIYFSHGNVHPLYAAAAVLGVLGGTRIGTRIAARIRGRTLIYVFVVLLVAVAARMFLS